MPKTVRFNQRMSARLFLHSGVEEGAVNSAIYLEETAKAPSERRLRSYHDSDIGLRTKNWQKQTAATGKQRLREKLAKL